MTASYRWVQWNRHKVAYDLVLVGLCVLFLVAFVAVTTLTHTGDRQISVLIVLMRGFALLAFVLLHVILVIGPLSRFTPLVAPLLYNRRHLGVTMFLCACMHAALALLFYGGFGVRDPVSAVVAGYDSFDTVSGFPFELLGLGALLVLFAMAATSHDFWLGFLSHRTWKALHMLVYVAYALILLHVTLGAMQSNFDYFWLVASGPVLIAGLHVAAGLKEAYRDRTGVAASGRNWVDVGGVDDFELDRGRAICLHGEERVAIFRHAGGFSAMSNVCRHQGGPLGEGRIVNGCVTCPWHGYQYLPENGQSPPPYTEKIPTYELRIEGGRVLLNPEAKAPGSPVTPARAEGEAVAALAAAPTDTKPAKPEPAKPEPAKPEPADPEPKQPKPGRPEAGETEASDV